eukprot:jgi/Chrpa1/14801/Chrysochromulina_OHIO_Genome00005832-RA
MPSATSTATAEATATEVQSLGVIRNLLRLNVSQILYARGCLPESDFETKDVEGMRVQSLGGRPEISKTAETLIAWIEKGIFSALYKRFLEKAVLCFSEDEAGKHVLEAWVLSIAWEVDEQGVEKPTITFGPDKRRAAALTGVFEPHAKVTKARVRQMYSLMLRQISLMLCTLPALPSNHFVFMRLLYRDGLTPADYEPSGFESAAADDRASLCFLTKPMQLTVAQPVATGHHSYRMHVVSSFLEDDAFAPSGLKRKAPAGPREQQSWQLDLGASVAGELGAHADELDEPTMTEYVACARRLVEEEEEGAPFTSVALARELGCSRAGAERVLHVLERERLLTEFRPRESARLVQRTGRTVKGTDDGSKSQSDGSQSPHPSARCSAAAAATTTPGTFDIGATAAMTPGRLLKKVRRAEEEEEEAPASRKVSATVLTVPSQPPTPAPRASKTPMPARTSSGRGRP